MTAAEAFDAMGLAACIAIVGVLIIVGWDLLDRWRQRRYFDRQWEAAVGF